MNLASVLSLVLHICRLWPMRSLVTADSCLMSILSLVPMDILCLELALIQWSFCLSIKINFCHPPGLY